MAFSAAVLVAAACGCTMPSFAPRSDTTALELAADARHDAEKLPDSPEKKTLLSRLDTLNQVLTGSMTPAASEVVSASCWYDLFGPRRSEVSYFTKFASFGEGTNNGLVVRVRLLDRFGDPVKALGSFRIETFEYIPRSLEPRGRQIGNWYVSVLSESDVRSYYDTVDRTFRFPVEFASPVTAARLVVQVTYYLPDGTGRKLIDQRVIKPGE
jgi:hypothetical protein